MKCWANKELTKTTQTRGKNGRTTSREPRR